MSIARSENQWEYTGNFFGSSTLLAMELDETAQSFGTTGGPTDVSTDR